MPGSHPGDLLDPGIEPASLESYALADSLPLHCMAVKASKHSQCLYLSAGDH